MIAWWSIPLVTGTVLLGPFVALRPTPLPRAWRDRLHWALGEFLVPFGVAVICVMVAALLHSTLHPLP